MSAPIDEQQMRAAWEAAIKDCLTGHESCSYGGMTPQTGYWLQDEDCRRNHGETCVWCGSDADTGFCDWAADGFSIYRVPACMACALKWVEIDPRWARSAPEQEATP